MGYIKISWEDLRMMHLNKSLNMYYIEENILYRIFLNNLGMIFTCFVHKTDPKSAEQLDFETNYKPACNKPDTPVQIPSYVSSISNGLNITYNTTETSLTTNSFQTVYQCVGQCNLYNLKFEVNKHNVSVKLTVDDKVIFDFSDMDLLYDFKFNEWNNYGTNSFIGFPDWGVMNFSPPSPIKAQSLVKLEIKAKSTGTKLKRILSITEEL